MHCPRLAHKQVVKRILPYLCLNPNFSFHFSHDSSFALSIFFFTLTGSGAPMTTNSLVDTVCILVLTLSSGVPKSNPQLPIPPLKSITKLLQTQLMRSFGFNLFLAS